VDNVQRIRPVRAALAAVTLATTLVACDSSADSGARAAAADRANEAGADPALADTLTRLIADAYDFSRADVVERMTALYADGDSVVSASQGRVITGADSIRQGIATFWRVDGRNMRNPKWTWGDVHVDRLGPDAAVLTATWTLPHLTPANQTHVLGGAWTAVFRRINGQWKIVHEHLSEPTPQ
jgi:ketosteroid isomerase-like protein